MSKPMRAVCAFFFSCLIFISFPSSAQDDGTQLVLLRHEKIINRYLPGSVIIYKLKNADEYMTSLILGVREFSIITSFDTIPFNKIDRVSLKGLPNKGANNLFGSFIMLAGIGYFAVDEINSILVHGKGFDKDPAVWKPAAILVATGFLLKQIHRRSTRVRFPVKLLAVKEGHPFYHHDE